MPDRSTLKIVLCALLVILALTLRLAILPLAFGRAPVGDPLNYVQIAQNILDGRGMVNSGSPWYEGLRAHYPPLYPFLLSFVGLFAPLKAQTFLVLNFVIDLLTCATIVWLSRLMNLRLGLVAAFAYLLWPTNLIMSPVAQKEGLSALFLCLLVGILLSATKEPTRSTAGLFGVVAGLTALNQPALATIPALLAIAFYSLFPSRRDWLRTVGLGVLAASLIMLPWWIRNYLIFGQFIPLTSSSGFAFWIGTFGAVDEWTPVRQDLLHVGNGMEISKAAAKEAMAWIISNPVEYLKHIGDKALFMVNPDRWQAKPLFWMRPFVAPEQWVIQVPKYASGALFVLTAIGLLITKGPLRRVVIACLIQLFLIQVWMEFPERQRYFMVPLLIILAIEGLRQFAAALVRTIPWTEKEVAPA